MGEADIRTRAYMSKPEVFADAFNFVLYGGKKVLHAEKLQEIDTAVIADLFDPATEKDAGYSDNDHASESGSGIRQGYRDILKLWTAKRDDHAVYLLLGEESQTNIHYAMPVKTGMYDFANYDSQVKSRDRKNRALRKEGKLRLSGAEYISGFRKEDRLIPVITLTIYFGADEWDGPRSLHEMFGPLPDEGLLRYINDYHINLLTPAEIEQKDFARFSSGLGLVLEYIKCSNDKEKMQELSRDKRYSAVDIEEALLINTLTRSRLKIKEGKGKVNMCKAIQDLREEERAEGRAEGKIEGDENRLIKDIHNVMESFGCTIERAMDALKVPIEERYRYMR